MTSAPIHPVPGGRPPVSVVDGNAIAGLLSTVFTGDATMMVVGCAHCGHAGRLAESVVERDDDAAIVRCRGCTRTLFTVDCGPGGEAVELRLASIGMLGVGPG